MKKAITYLFLSVLALICVATFAPVNAQQEPLLLAPKQ